MAGRNKFMYKYLYFILLALFGSGNFALADTTTLKITEVMYDFPGTDDGHEYIKIENTGTDPVDITGYKFIDGGSATKHAINLPPKNGSTGSPIITSSDFLILADNAVTYLADNPSFSGSVLDSTFSLNNDGATVQLIDKDDNVAVSYTYPQNNPPPPPDDDGNGDQIEPPKIIINEIMYDIGGSDDGYEWIEVYNTGFGDVDLSTLKFFEAETNHAISAFNGGTSVISSAGFAIVAEDPEKFLIDWPDYQGLIFDSSFSLSNEGETLTIKDADGNIIDQISYTSDQGGAGDERSLQRNGDNLIEALPTPGAINKTTVEPPPPPDDSNDNSSGSSGGGGGSSNNSSTSSGSSGGSSGGSTSNPAKKTTIKASPAKISLKIDSPDYVIANSSFNISASGETGKYVWNFGNGETIEKKDGESFAFTYQFPGEYKIILNYFKDEKAKSLKATAKIKVEENPIIISSVKDDGSVEIKNSATHELDLSGWVVKAGETSFILPEETVLVAGGKIVLSAKIIKVAIGEKDISLLYPAGGTAFSFGVKPVEATKVSEPKPLPEAKPETASIQSITEPAQPSLISVKGSELSASAIGSVSSNNFKTVFPWALGLVGIITLSSLLSLKIFPKGLNFFSASQKQAPSSNIKILD